MSLVRGVTVLDLISQIPAGAQGFLPDAVARFIDLLNIAEVRTRSSTQFFVHEGRVQSATEAGLDLGASFPVEIPGLNAGVPFQLAWVRPAVGTGAADLEGEPTGWFLDLFLDRVAVVIPIGKPAKLVPAAPVAPAHLEAGTGTRVKLYARGVLRIEGGPSGTRVRVVADPDPLVPSTPIGTVIETGFSPPHLLLHDSGMGLTVDRVTLDLTDAFTPEDIVARGHGADFEGMTIREATVYLPRNIPFVGDVNFGVRDVLVGWAPTPALQGTGRLELGVPLESATGVAFFEEIDGQVIALGAPAGSGLELTVTVHADTGPTARLFAEFATPGVVADWRLPDGSSVQGGDSGWFEVGMAPGAPSLRVVERRTATDGTVSDGQQRTYAFVRAAAPTEPEHAPPIKVLHSNGASHEWDNVVFLRDGGGEIDFVQFRADDTGLTDEDRDGLRWQWESDGSTRSGSGVIFDLDTGWATGTHTVTLTDRHGHVRRCRIEMVPGGDLFVGHHGGVQQVRGATDTDATILAVENSWDLAAFHARDARDEAREAATLDGGTLTVPRGTLAEVTIAVGTPTDPGEDAPTTAPASRHARILMEFNEAGGLNPGEGGPTGWRQLHTTDADPYGAPEPYPAFVGGVADVPPEEQLDASFTVAELGAWAGGFTTGTRFVVIGRCCDLGTETRNRTLATQRAQRGSELLVAAGITADRIRFVGEQGTAAGTEPGYAAALQFTSPPLDPMADPQLGPRITEGWRFKDYYASATRTAWGSAQGQPERVEGRGVDIYAIVPAGDAADDPDPGDETTRSPDLVRALVPGDDADVIEPIDAASVRLPYRVEIQLTWDSPSIIAQIDWVPTLVQLTVEWASSAVPVPGLPGETVTPHRPTPSTGPELWRVIGRFTTDQRSGQTSYFLSLDSMGDADGLFSIVDPSPGRADEAVAVALALAPALLGGITTDDPAGAAVRIGALIAASAAAAAVQIGSDHVINDGKVIVEKLEGEVRLRAIDATEGMKIRIGVDYTASFGVMANVAGAVGVATLAPVKIKYKNVGLEYEHDESRPLFERIRFVFEDAKFEVSDPGQWQITGALGRLLGITAIRVGAGSVWVEVDLEFSLDLGVVEISRTTIRVEIDTSGPTPSISVQLRGITAKIDVPGAVKGIGSLQVLPDGFGASLELDIIPPKLKAWGGFAVRDPDMVHIEGGVRFAVGIPLGSTGLGLYGFAGRFVANGTRNVNQADTDIIGREVGWHALALPSKYNPQHGQFAIGFGVYIGTLPDTGFTFNALGMLTIGFPDISVVFSIDAVLLSGETKSATEQKAPPSSALTLLGIVAIDPTAIGIAIQGRYEIPKVLKLEVPIGAYFPLQSSGVGGYVRVGSDGAGGRPDRPVTIRILPDVLDLRAFSFFMVEERNLHDLGGKAWLDFEGFSIGFGAGLSVKWGGGPIYLKASLTLLVGMGTRPLVLAGGIYVQGELRLVIISISVSGEIEFLIAEGGSQLHGEFCGSIDFFFFSIEGCVSFSVGSAPTIPPPPPDPLISGLVLSDKFSRVVGEGATSLAAITDANRAWPDVAPVLHFAHRVKVLLDGIGFQPTPSAGWSGLDWSGTNRVRYLYLLEGVELIKHPASGAPELLDTSTWPATWWLPAFRNAVPDPGDTAASSHEGWELALLQWDPAPWARAHSDGGDGLDADPAGSLGNVCDDPPRPTRTCVLGKDGQRYNIGRVRIVGEPSGQTPYPPDFLVDLQEGMPPALGVPQLAALATVLGVGFSPGGAEALPVPFTPPGESVALTGAWRAPRFTRAGFTAMSLGMIGDFVPEVFEPQILLAICLELPDFGDQIQTCVSFARVQPGQQLGPSVTIDNVKFDDRGGNLRSVDRFPLGAPNGVSELAFSLQGLVATLPQLADSVSIDLGVIEDKTVVMIALGADGKELTRVQASGTSLMVHTLEVRATGIHQVLIFASSGSGHLIRFCYTTDAVRDEKAVLEAILERFGPPRTQPRLSTRAAQPARLPLPLVRGVRAGITEAWPGEVIGVEIGDRHGCVYIRYSPKLPGPWSRFIVGPYPWFSVGLVRACGIRYGAVVASDQDNQARAELQLLWNEAVSGGALARYMLLDPDTRYEVRVRYKAATWVGAVATDNPPDAAGFDFTATSAITVADLSQSLYFRTAPLGALADDKVAAFADQHRFDPRALVRYLRGFDPSAEDPSHFRGDAMLAWFEVEWIVGLLDRYGHDLELVVQRTDPPPTPPTGVGPIVFPVLTVNWTSLPYELRNLADRRMIDAAIAAPCLEDSPHEGATAQVTAELEPRARYDLVVRAKPRPSGPAIEIGRSHFRASRYRTATELIEATGFGVATGNPFFPLDLLVTAAPPSDARLADDALLDAAISAMGLDPFAPAVGPRSVALWREVGTTWKLVGIMLDSDEALIRGPRLVDPVPNPPRLQILRAQVPGIPWPGVSELLPKRSNVSATRVLLAAPSGIAVPADATLELVFQEPSGLKIGRRSLLSMPLVIAQERP